MLQRDRSGRAQLDRLSRELSGRVLQLGSIPERVEQDRLIYVGEQLYLGVGKKWEPIGLRIEQPWSSEIPAADE